MAGFRDLSSQTFDQLTVLYRDTTSTATTTKWICQCTCGTIKSIYGSALRQKLTRSCGCLNRALLAQRTEDLTGRRFDKLLVVAKASQSVNQPGHTRWTCQCDCGRIIIALRQNLRRGLTRSCGCLRESKIEDLTGQRFDRLTVLSRQKHHNPNTRGVYWLCRCACGTERIVSGHCLRNNKTHSCGCLAKDKHPRGANHPLWQGGKTPVAMRVRHSPAYKEWREHIFQRDNYTCALCNAHGNRLQAHHIQRFSQRPELALDIYNGITLCQSCHHFIHGKEEAYVTFFTTIIESYHAPF